jgi:thioredoxin-related protein
VLLIAGTKSYGQVNWVTIKEAQTAYRETQRPLMIYIYTDWCKICKLQDQSVFADSLMINSINQCFIASKINAESKDSIQFLGRSYRGASNQRYHEIAEYLAKEKGEKLSFPSLIFLNKELEFTYRKTGFMSKEELLNLLNEIGETKCIN